MLIIEWCLIQLSRNEAALGSRGVSHTFDPRELGTNMQVISKNWGGWCDLWLVNDCEENFGSGNQKWDYIFKIEAFICKKKGPLENFWCSFTEIKVASGLTKVVSKIQENFQNTEKAIFKSFVWFHLDFLLWDAIVQSIET